MTNKDEEERIYVSDIADAFDFDNRVVFRKQGWHLYDGRCYAPVPEDDILSRVSRVTRDFGRESPRMIRDATDLLRYRHYSSGGHQPYWFYTPDRIAPVLVLENGILDMSPLLDDPPGKIELLAHNPGLFATGCCDYPYLPGATCPVFDDFLDWFACGDQIVSRLVLEMMAYCLILNLPYQKFFFLIGDGSNGKSVLLNAIRRMVGKSNCSALNIERFGGRFDLAMLCDKHVNISADMTGGTNRVSEGAIKMLCDKSPLTVERKGKDPHVTRNHARLICATNEMPKFLDRTDGIWRRLIIIPAQARVSDDERVDDLEDRFRYSGILNRVLEVVPGLIDRGGFVMPEISLDIIRQERREANPAADFLASFTDLHDDGFTVTDALHQRYKQWCETYGYKPLGVAKFGVEIRRHYSAAIKSGQVRHGKSASVSRSAAPLEIAQPRKNGYHGISYHADGVEEDRQRADFQKQVANTYRQNQAVEAKKHLEQIAVEREKAAIAANRLEVRRARRLEEKAQPASGEQFNEIVGGFTDQKIAKQEARIESARRSLDDEEDDDLADILLALEETSNE